MTKIWIAEWEIAPGDGVHIERYSTLAEAKAEMRKKISQTLNLDKYISWLYNEEDVDCKDVAHFLKSYLSDPQFPRSVSDVPDDDEAPEHCDLWLSTTGIIWDYRYDECPHLHTNMVLEPPDDEALEFDFWYAHPENLDGEPNIALSIRIREETIWGTSAYPLMVLFALNKEPATQEQIADRIRYTWETVIDRKAVGRHLQLLQDMGFPVQKCAEGYYRSEEAQAPKPDIKYSPNAYPLLIMQVLDSSPKTQAEIIHTVQEKYGVRIDRKAVKRHLELLEALFYRIQKSNDGYSIQK